MEKTIDELKQDVLLKIYSQRYEHVRHLQAMRATYFNLYIVVIGFSVAAFVSISNDLSTFIDEAAAIVGGMIWTFSMITMIRAERWGGHISHDLCTIRRIHNVLISDYAFLSDIIQTRPSMLTSIEYDRPLWSRNRSIETPTSILGCFICAIFIGYFVPFVVWLKIGVSIFLIILPIIAWRSEVSNLKHRHARCCMLESAKK